MDCHPDSEFNGDSAGIDEKTKESILLMKKKMLRSHDLILQYNNKLKECERLKGDLCSAQEEVTKLKRESNANLAKVVKLELLNAEHKKSQQDFERRLADKDVLIASDKCHLQQLVCKVEDIEDKHSEKLMEVELEKSSLEVKVKNLEQELKALRKSHLTEVTKLEKTINGLPPKTRKGAIKVVKETNDIGVNTTAEPVRAQPVKPVTAEKGVLTNEFYHITDNPYPLFCDKCESSVEPSVEKICKIMTAHPPLLTEMLSPVRRREIPSATVSRSRQDSRAFDSNDLKFGHNDFRRNDLDPSQTSINEFNRVDPIPRNFVSPFESTITNFQSSTVARPIDTVNPELENLRRKVETLERKIKKRKRQKSSENCCNQSRSVSCCGHGQPYANQVPNLFNNGQLDMMTEFWKRMATFTNEPAPTLDRPRKPKKKKTIKLRRLKKKAKMKNMKKMKNCGSTGWEIESEDCETEINVDHSESQNSHILRIRPNDVETIESSPVKVVPHRVDRSTKKGSYIETASNRASPVKVPDKPEDNGRKSVSSFSDVEDVRMDDDSSRHETAENSEQTTNSRCPTVEIKDRPNSVTVSNSSDGEMTNISHDTAESAYFSEKSAGDETTSMSHEESSQVNSFDANFKAALPTEQSVLNSKQNSRNSDFVRASQNSSIEKSISVCSDTDLSDVPAEEDFDADLQDQLITRKRKRSCSPKVTKRTTRSMKSLFGKIRGLKKNTVTGAVKTRRSNSYETRNRLKITNGTEKEEHEGETVNTDSPARASLILESEPDARVPAKKPRIAHVPKNENTSEEQENPPTRKSRQAAKQISQNTVEKSSKCPKPTTRRSILNDKKSEDNDTVTGGETLTLDNLEIIRPTLPVGATEICRRERTRAKRNSPMDSPLPLKQPANGKLEDPSLPKFSSTSSSTESPASPPVIEVSPEIRESPQNRETVSREIFNDYQETEKTADLPESPSEEDNQIGPSLTDKITKSTGTKLTEISDADGGEIKESDNRKILDADGAEIGEPDTGQISDADYAELSEPDSRKISEADGAKINEPDSRKISDADSADISEPDSRKISDADGADISEPDSPKISDTVGAEISESDSRQISDADGAKISETDSQQISQIEDKYGATLSKKLDATSESGSAETAKEQPIPEVSLTDLDQIAKDPKAVPDESEVRSMPIETIEATAECAPPTGTEEIDSPESPASCSSLEKFPTDPATSARSPIRSPLYSNVKLTEPSTPSHPESTAEKSSLNAAKNLGFTDPTESSEDLPSLTKSILFAKLTEDSSLPKNLVSPPTIPADARTAKPENTPRLFSNHQLPVQPALHPKNRQQRLPIHNKALLPIHPQISSTSTLPYKSSTRPTEILGSTICFTDNRTEVELPANATVASISSNNSADKPADVPKICDNIEKASSLSKVYDTTVQKYVVAELDSEIDSSPQLFDNNFDAKKKKKPTKRPANVCPEATKVLKELRSRQVLSSPATPANQRNSPAMKNSKEETVDCKSNLSKIPCPGIFLGRYLGEQKKKSKFTKVQRIAAMELLAAAEKIVKAELDRLVESEEWTSELHQSVIARLKEVASRRTVAKSIVDLLVERAALDEQLDRTHTPPAPVMTRSQQRIVALLSGLDRDGIMPGVFELVQDGIEFALFRLGHTPEFTVIEGLVRIFTAMARMKKDRERVRILCCDSLYCLIRKAFTVIYVALTVWPEVFPMHGSCEDELPNCIAHLIKIDECTKEQAPRLMHLKRMITDFYNYPHFQARSGVIITGLMQALQKNYTDDLEAAVLLIAKKEGPDWTHNNIINGGLMKIIDDSSYPSSFNAISLLGFILRSFPLTDPLGVMEKIGEKLYQMIESGEGPPRQQEGVVSALMSVSRRNEHYNKIADIVLNWKPSQTMQIRTTEQLSGFFKMRAVTYWNQRNQLRFKNNNTVNEKNNRDEKKASQKVA